MKMQLKTFISFLIVLFYIVHNAEAQDLDEDCAVLRTLCDRCVRSIPDNSAENALIRHANENCRRLTRDVWIWRDLRRCEMANIRCRHVRTRLICEEIARIAGMRRVR